MEYGVQHRSAAQITAFRVTCVLRTVCETAARRSDLPKKKQTHIPKVQTSTRQGSHYVFTYYSTTDV